MSDWYYAVNNEQKGPVNESEIKTQLASGRLPGDTLVWKDGMANWTAASQVSAFTFRPPPVPALADPSLGATTLTPAPDKVVKAPGTTDPESATPLSVAGLMGGGEALEVDPEDAENNKIFGILSYLSILFLVPLVVAKNSPFAKYHANQGLTLFILELALWVVTTIIDGILGMIGLPYGGFIIGSVVLLTVVALVILGIINAAAGKCVPLPIIGKFKLIK